MNIVSCLLASTIYRAYWNQLTGLEHWTGLLEQPLNPKLRKSNTMEPLDSRRSTTVQLLWSTGIDPDYLGLPKIVYTVYSSSEHDRRLPLRDSAVLIYPGLFLTLVGLCDI